jgi:hypothetical protein
MAIFTVAQRTGQWCVIHAPSDMSAASFRHQEHADACAADLNDLAAAVPDCASLSPRIETRRAMQEVRAPHMAADAANVVKVNKTKPRAKRGANTETALQSDIANALRAAGCYVERRNTGLVETKNGTRVYLAPHGTPDLFVLLPSGQAWFVEVKTDTGTVTPIQREKHAELRAAGGLVDVVRSVGEVLALLIQYRGEIRRASQ